MQVVRRADHPAHEQVAGHVPRGHRGHRDGELGQVGGLAGDLQVPVLVEHLHGAGRPKDPPATAVFCHALAADGPVVAQQVHGNLLVVVVKQGRAARQRTGEGECQG